MSFCHTLWPSEHSVCEIPPGPHPAQPEEHGVGHRPRRHSGRQVRLGPAAGTHRERLTPGFGAQRVRKRDVPKRRPWGAGPIQRLPASPETRVPVMSPRPRVLPSETLTTLGPAQLVDACWPTAPVEGAAPAEPGGAGCSWRRGQAGGPRHTVQAWFATPRAPCAHSLDALRTGAEGTPTRPVALIGSRVSRGVWERLAG